MTDAAPVLNYHEIDMTKSVSIIVPCYNEEHTITDLLESIQKQTYPQKNIEVIIADGMSTDNTRCKIVEFQDKAPELAIKIVDNPLQAIPAGLNLAIQVAGGEIILRLDAHCQPMPDYVTRSVHDLMQGLGKNVGGLWKIKPGKDTWMARAIAASAAHPLAVGDAYYRYSETAGVVDTVPFGAFWKSYLDELGGYNEALLANEDYELNTRIRLQGHNVWFDPLIQSYYYARSDLRSLAKQYWRYGYWKAKMLRKYPASLRLRQAIPPLFVLGWALLITASFFSVLFRWLFVLMVLLYILLLVGAALPVVIKKRDIFYLLGMPIAIATMHFCWGAGFLRSLFL